jgi:flagellar motor switch protein FliN/FliY
MANPHPGTARPATSTRGLGLTANSARDADPRESAHARGDSPAASNRTADLSRILGLYVPVSVMLADREMPVEQILKMNVGTIIEFDVPFDSELVLEVADRPIGRGLAVKLGENFGLRVTQIGNVESRIIAMRGRRSAT